MSSSILFPSGGQPVLDGPSAASHDLHLDEVIEQITSAYAEYQLAPILFTPLHSCDDVEFRQAVFADVARPDLRGAIDEFAEGMRDVRRLLRGLGQLRFPREQQAWFLDAADRYCHSVDALTAHLAAAELGSVGLRGVRDHLVSLTQSADYIGLRADTIRVRDGLRSIRYRLTVTGDRIVIEDDHGESDYSHDVLATFERFRQREGIQPAEKERSSTNLNHVDAAVLDRVARLNPSEFAALGSFCDAHHNFIEAGVTLFDREIQFFLAITDFMNRLESDGLPTCLPEVSENSSALDAHDVYDIALANKLLGTPQHIVTNDVRLFGDERIIVVTGPNQGGKTTFARMFGQLHHFAALGGSVPGRRVQIGLFDHIFTHYERSEDLTNLSGKLEEELVRLHQILHRATSRSIVVMNETFGSTTLRDSRLLGAASLERLIDLDLRAIYVTFIDELANYDPSVVSMVSTVDDDDPAVRTFKVLRRPADGLAYAISLAELHGLTPAQLTERIGT